MSAPPLFAYRPGSSPVHRVPALVKLALYALVATGALAVPPLALVPLAACLFAVSCLARLSPASLLGAARALLAYALAVAFFRVLGADKDELIPALSDAGVYLARLALILLGGSIFFETTSSCALRAGLESIQDAIQSIIERLPGPTKRLRVPDLALSLSLTVSFIPRVFSAWEKVDRAYRVRAGNGRGPRAAYRRICVLIPAMILALLAGAVDTDRALRNRSPRYH